MVDPATAIVLGDNPEQAIGEMDAMMPQLAPDVRKQLNRIKMMYWQRYGLEDPLQAHSQSVHCEDSCRV